MHVDVKAKLMLGAAESALALLPNATDAIVLVCVPDTDNPLGFTVEAGIAGEGGCADCGRLISACAELCSRLAKNLGPRG
jgi:hypothetical protein